MRTSEYLIKMALLFEEPSKLMPEFMREDQRSMEERKRDRTKVLLSAGGLGVAYAANPVAMHFYEKAMKNAPEMSRAEVDAARQAMGIKANIYLNTELINKRPSMYAGKGVEKGPLLKTDPVMRIGDKYITLPLTSKEQVKAIQARRLHDLETGFIASDAKRPVVLHEMGHAQDLERSGDWRLTLTGMSRRLLPYAGGVAGGALAGGTDPTRGPGSAMLRGVLGGMAGGVVGGLPQLYTEGKASWLAAQQAGKAFGDEAKWQTLKQLSPAFGTYLGAKLWHGAVSGGLSSVLIRKIRLAMIKKRKKDELKRKLSSQ